MLQYDHKGKLDETISLSVKATLKIKLPLISPGIRQFRRAYKLRVSYPRGLIIGIENNL